MKLYIITLLLICLTCIPIACSENITDNITSNLTSNITTNITNTTPTLTQIIKTPEEFYGNVTYTDGSLILAGSEITAMDMTGKIIGNFTLTTDGSYGDEYKNTPRLLVVAEKDGDLIEFYVNNVKALKTMKYDSASIKRLDLVIPASAKPTPTPTPIPTPTPTPVIQQTTIPTPIPTTITTIPTPSPTQTPTPLLNDTTMKFLGVLCIALGICVIGALLTYFILTKKMKREDEEDIIL